MSVSVIVPTWNESENVLELAERLAKIGCVTEVIFVDDSLDERTITAIEKAAATYGSHSFFIVGIHRLGSDRTGGLSGAVMRGIDEATNDIVVIMDGDLQHPPETIPSLVVALDLGGGIAIASRYCGAGSSQGLDGLGRQVVSRASTYVAKFVFPLRLRGGNRPHDWILRYTQTRYQEGEIEPTRVQDPT